MVSILRLLHYQKISASLFGFGSLLLILAASLETNIEIQKMRGLKVYYTPSPAQITAFAFGVLLIGSLISAITASLKLEQPSAKQPTAIQHMSKQQIKLPSTKQPSTKQPSTKQPKNAKQQNVKPSKGAGKRSLAPGLWIFIGSWVLFFGVLALFIGGIAAVEEGREEIVF